MTGFWCERAWLPPDGTARRPERHGAAVDGVRVAVDNAGMIMGVQVDARPEPGDVHLHGMVFPGFANAHSHAFHRVLRGRTHQDGGTFWTWRESMYAVAGMLTPDSYYRLARAVYAEMVLAGITSVGEFHYLHHGPGGTPYSDQNAMGIALAEAAADAGIRLTLLDTCYLRGGIDKPLRGVQARFGDGDAESWADRVTRLRASVPPAVVVGAALHSVRAVPETELHVVAGWARDVVAPLHVHLSEQPAENEACLATYGRTPTAVLADAGVLGPRTTAVHATHLTRADVALLGRSGTSVCGCPTTEQDLADGISPMGALASAGCAVCLGSDQHAVVDLLGEARLLEMHERLSGGQRGRFSPGALVDALTRNGQAALGRPGDGRIAHGATADLVAVRTDTVRTAGSDPAQLVLTATAADVDTVVAGGRVVVDGGKHLLGDITTLLTDSITPLFP
ncbi:formimidoylglutamate deiminase [Phytoactinopolyspora alkaliphila]|uniref:Formimidoylglutamate deiminase n=1 Tax=Phytoactinopolyspora alkaliphila TaxID=1783498 RepID=A0A6N9YHA0_9ACTN|nr:formimidoylglutamate deiminase [Phytoactinopolyspora alkaliphila]NED94307.1 formimidoylglutamate deiminase [Phytoactinopolyspora alkaliphila]